MLLDKGYYDYDYEPVKKKRKYVPEDKEVWSQDKLNAILGVKPRRLSPAELQATVRGEIQNEN